MKHLFTTKTIAILSCLLSACGNGGTQTDGLYISAATTGNCNPMTEGSCAINLVFNTNAVPNLSIAYSATPQTLPAFGINTSTCIPQGIIGTQECTINVTYTPAACTPGNQNETVIFSLSTAQSNPIVLSCQ